MRPAARSRITATFLAASLGLAGCVSGGGRRAAEAPKWVTQRPAPTASRLYFVGEASGQSDEASARAQARAMAINELTVYCGATVKSESEDRQEEQNGVLVSTYAVTVDIAGDELTLREATVKETVTTQADDGSFTGYVLLEWPRAQYENVLAMQRARAERALALYLEAEAASDGNRFQEARAKLADTRSILGPMRSQIPLRHEKLKTSALLADAAQALATHLDAREAERKKVVAVAVECNEDKAPKACKSQRVGSVREAVAGSGLKVSADGVPSDVAREILASGSPRTDAAVRASGLVLAVQYDADLLAREDGFVFVHCGARGVMYDTDAHRIVQVKEVKPVKGGHVHFEGAAEKGCQKAEEEVLGWVRGELERLK
jgi:hypothetical protein